LNDYQAALDSERAIYSGNLEVHRLPDAFHYWSNRYLLPKLLAHGFRSPDEMFLQSLAVQCTLHPRTQILSIGAGNADLELKLAAQLRNLGHDNFVIECLDLNPEMLARGQAAAHQAHLADHLRFVLADFNHWRAQRTYHAIIANQSLHHVIHLEGLFEEIKRSLHPQGVFAISDMIGRNGHLRWPEALRHVRDFWRELPPSYRFNQKLQRYEETFADWDCSGEGFEGVRAQDILPLLLDRFHFHTFIPFGNLIDPFIDRSFGGHFDLDQPYDRAFLDRVHARDEFEIASGNLTPTHLLAICRTTPHPTTLRATDLRRFVRNPEHTPRPTSEPIAAPYEWSAWPHPAQPQLELVCHHLAESAQLVASRTAWVRGLQTEVEQRTAQALHWRDESARHETWALGLEQDVVDRTRWAQNLESQLNERTAWAQHLATDLAEHVAAVSQLTGELETRTEWAQSLDRELAERTAWALRIESELLAERLRSAELHANPFRALKQFLRSLIARLPRNLPLASGEN